MYKYTKLDFAVGLAFGWGISLDLSVALGLSFALPMAAGGQFETFPTSIRVTYLLQSLFIFLQAFLYNQSANGLSVKPKWVFLVLTILSALGFVMNLFSFSVIEKINVVPLAVMTYGFWLQHKKQQML